MYGGNVVYEKVEIIDFIYEENKSYKYGVENKLNPEFRYIPMDFDKDRKIKKIDLISELGEYKNKKNPFYIELRLRASFKILSQDYDDSMEDYIIERFIKGDVMRRSLTIISNVLIKSNRYNAHHILKLN